ncbi:helix-turn-helix domain-containing protein [Paenibacillus senegalimassiliensis]|uniref:helix-turn-helix domain-containing protein n=1 Tax=Paenibacillus senegalimassiliensis TaxID=1737426 RepID=UPI00073EFB10|nr:helix-turn-helix domain-containing protein [Paenibacillus senegalimassiliensis]
MTALEKAIADIVTLHVSEAEKRILERLSAASDKTLTFSEACDYLKMSDYTLRNLCKAKRIPHRTVGAEGSKSPRYLFSTASLDKWKREEEAKNYRREEQSS